MKVIIAGSRDIKYSLEELEALIHQSGYDITEVISGGARGIDRLGEEWAQKREIANTKYLPDWENEGKKAGVLRNKEMVKDADALIAVWDGKSRGTQSTIKFAEEKKIPMTIVIVEPKSE